MAEALATAVAPLAPKASPSFTGSPAFVTVITPAALAADTADYNPANLHACMTVRLSTATSATVKLSGLHAGRDGEFKLLDNVGLGDLVIADEAAASTAANRFALAADHTIRPGQSLMLRYDATSTRWRAVASVARPTFPVGMRAQFDIPPPSPWLPLTGGTALIASYPQIATKFNAPTAAAVASVEEFVLDATRFAFPDGGGSSWRPYAFTKGAGYYWAIFIRSAGSSWSLCTFKSLNPTSGYAWVSTETNVALQAGSAGVDPMTLGNNLACRGVVWGNNQGLYTIGNTLMIIEATGCTRRDDVFPSSAWNYTSSKLFAYGAGTWVAMEANVSSWYGTAPGQAGFAPQVATCANPKAAWTDRGMGGPSAWSAYNSSGQTGYVQITKLVFAFGKFWALNIYQGGAATWSSAVGYGDWTQFRTGDWPISSLAFVDMVFDGTALWITNRYNGSVQRATYRMTDGLSWTATTDAGSPPNGPMVPVDAPAWTGVFTYRYGGSEYMPCILAASVAGSFPMTASSTIASTIASSTATTLFDAAAGRIVQLYAWNYVGTLTMAVNPATTFSLPNVGTTPPTYIYGR